MAGPTPVSALIHAATMVTAGVYLIARMHPLYQISGTAMTAVAIVGALTLFDIRLQCYRTKRHQAGAGLPQPSAR
ncbi:proton-conducting transporter membrane subunit [Microbulbifer sp. A4B17]|uniref:proton-conducting transporter transmembrane domain-containing protein n=1 Tax=Microbulbifer sp. A4B17 TaxID=359370 RepID=UPI00272CAB9F|nr:proton-conducting transporter membrane subunit [Microbulbifer sp. A4B17]